MSLSLADWEASELIHGYIRGMSGLALAEKYRISLRTVRRYIARHPGKRGRCVVGECPTITPRPVCRFHENRTAVR